MHGWKRNPKAPTSLWDGLVLDGAYAGLHPGTNRFVDGSGLENHGTLTNMDASTDWVWSDELGRWALDFDGSNDLVVTPVIALGTTYSLSWCMQYTKTTGGEPIGGANLNNSYGCYVNSPTTATTLIHSPIFPAASVASDSLGVLSPIELMHFSIVRKNARVEFYVRGLKLGGTKTLANNEPFSVSLLGSERLTPVYQFKGKLADVLFHNRDISPPEITWLADRSNRLYTPDTRRAIWVPTPFNPALMRRQRRMAGAR